MTLAVCFKCGSQKVGAFCPCPDCGQEPKTEDELAVSMVMTDHYFDQASLDRMSELTRRNGKPSDSVFESQGHVLKLIRRCLPLIPTIERLLDEEFDQDDVQEP